MDFPCLTFCAEGVVHPHLVSMHYIFFALDLYFSQNHLMYDPSNLEQRTSPLFGWIAIGAISCWPWYWSEYSPGSYLYFRGKRDEKFFKIYMQNTWFLFLPCIYLSCMLVSTIAHFKRGNGNFDFISSFIFVVFFVPLFSSL